MNNNEASVLERRTQAEGLHAPPRPGRTLAEAIDSHANGFNLVRLLAALLVVAFHCATPGIPDPITALVAPHTHLGEIAVAIFFLISGIFITKSWMNDPNLLRFAVRRIARIVPGLFVCLVLITVLAVVFFSDQGWRGLLTTAPWRYVFGSSLLHGLRDTIPPQELRLPGVLNGQDLNGPLWTLFWEGRMYVMVALVGVSAMLPMRAWLMGASAFLLVASHVFPMVLGGYVWEGNLLTMFLVGMWLQTVAPQARLGKIHVACACALVALGWTHSMATTQHGLTYFGIMLFFGALAMWLGMARLDRLSFIRRHDYSFGIYIYHWPLLLMVRAALPPMSAPITLGVTLLLVVPLAVLSWHFVELPAQRFARRLLARRQL